MTADSISTPVRSVAPWFTLPARLVLFAAFQAAFALGLGGWNASVAWWPLAATLANLVSIGLLIWLFRQEGLSFWKLFRVERQHMGSDLLVLAGAIVAAGALAYVPNIALGTAFFGSPEAPLELFIRPLPMWAAVAAVAFPLTIVFAELPLYYGYVMPRLEAQTGRPWLAVALAALFHAAQHMTLPLVLDLRFIAWRGLMFLPFALFVAVLLRWRPRLLPYLIVIHGILDLSIVAMLLAAVR